MSDIKKAKITLTQTEIEQAIKKYIQDTTSPKMNCVGPVEITKNSYGNTAASAEIEPPVFDPLAVVENNVYYKLRHRTTKLFVEAMVSTNKKVILAVGVSGLKWDSISQLFATIKKSVIKTDFNNKPIPNQPLLEQLKEDLLQFEIVHFGEVKTDDITFHINELAKL